MKNFASAIRTHKALMTWAAALVAVSVLAAVLFAGTGTVSAAQNVKTAAEYEAEIAALTLERDTANAALDEAVAARDEAENNSLQQSELLMQTQDELAKAQEENGILQQTLTEKEDELAQTQLERDQAAAELNRWQDYFGTQYNAVFEIRRKGTFFGLESCIWATIPVTREQAQQLSGMSAISQSLPFLSVPSGDICADWQVTLTNLYPSTVQFP